MGSQGTGAALQDLRFLHWVHILKQHCYVTGGSQGTGFCLALSLVKQGAHVSIVARDVNKLKTAVEKLEVNL